MLIEKVNFSHVYVKFSDRYHNRTLYYHATFTGMNFLAKRIFDKKYEVVYERSFTIQGAAKKEVVKWCIDNSGSNYGFQEIFGMLIVRFLGWFSLKIKNPFGTGPKQFFCSEAAAIILEKCGYKIISDKDSIGLVEIKQILKNLK
jgi:hypothetical protein